MVMRPKLWRTDGYRMFFFVKVGLLASQLGSFSLGYTPIFTSLPADRGLNLGGCLYTLSVHVFLFFFLYSGMVAQASSLEMGLVRILLCRTEDLVLRCR
jgi:hypothetical protein